MAREMGGVLERGDVLHPAQPNRDLRHLDVKSSKEELGHEERWPCESAPPDARAIHDQGGLEPHTRGGGGRGRPGGRVTRAAEERPAGE